MAAALAKRLEDETHSETLNSLISSLLAAHPSSSRATSIPALDEIINRTIYPPAPPTRDPFRDGSRSPSPPIDTHDPPHQATTTMPLSKDYTRPLSIELTSTQPKAGRTWLAHLIAAHALLGPSNQPQDTQPTGNAVIWIDIDHRLDIQRLHQLLLSQLRARRPQPRSPPTPPTADDAPHPSSPPTPTRPLTHDADAEAVEDSRTAHTLLAHLHVFRPSSFPSLLATLRAVPGLMLDTASHRSGGRLLSHVILSGITSFHWTERSRLEAQAAGLSESGASSAATSAAMSAAMSAAQSAAAEAERAVAATEALHRSDLDADAQTPPAGETTTTTTTATAASTAAGAGATSSRATINDRYATLALSLRDIQRQLHCTVISTRWVGQGAARLPRAWEEWVDVGVGVERERWARLPRAISVEEALEWEGRRREEGRGREEEREGKGGKVKEGRFRGVVLMEGRERGRVGMKVQRGEGKRGVLGEVWEMSEGGRG